MLCTQYQDQVILLFEQRAFIFEPSIKGFLNSNSTNKYVISHKSVSYDVFFFKKPVPNRYWALSLLISITMFIFYTNWMS